MKFTKYSFLGVLVLLFPLLYSGGPPPDTEEEQWKINLILTVAKEHNDLSAKFHQGEDFKGMANIMQDAKIFTPDNRMIQAPGAIISYWQQLRQGTPQKPRVEEVEFKIVNVEVIKREFMIGKEQYTAVGFVLCEYRYTRSNPNEEIEIGTYVQTRLHRQSCPW